MKKMKNRKMNSEFTDYEIDVINKVLSDELYRTSIGFENFDIGTNPETAAKVATIYVILKKIESKR